MSCVNFLSNMALFKNEATDLEFKSILESIEQKRYPLGIYGTSQSGKGYIVDGIFENIDIAKEAR